MRLLAVPRRKEAAGMTNFIDYNSPEFKTWLATLPEADQKLVLPAPLEEIGQLTDTQLERAADLERQFLKQHMLNVVKEYNGQHTNESTKELSLTELSDILSTSVIRDTEAKLITFLGMLLAQTNEDQLNIAFQSESAAGKTYLAIEIADYFPP
ncbi:MAG: hypothetical protein ACREBU_13960 [Nitrososphaera sp.]